jgi:nitroreductase
MPEPSQTIAEAIRTRRTINDFAPQRPPDEAILAAIELARWAPNHKLTEPWRFHLLGPQTAAAVVDLSTKLITAAKGPEAAESKRRKWATVPGWLVVTCRKSADPFREREDYAACCCAIQNLMLALWAQGIGTKWSTGDVTRHPDFAAALGIDPSQHDVVGLIWYGYPAQIPPTRRQEVEAIVTQHP